MFGFLAPIAKAVGGLFSAGNIGSTLGGIGSVLGGVAGLQQANKEGPTPRDNIMSQVAGVREAAKEYGFNPLTLLQYGQPGGSLQGGAGGAAPLASWQMLTDGLRDVSDAFTNKGERDRAREELELDLARLRIEQARSGVVVGPMGAADGVGGAPSPLGRRAVSLVTGSGASRGGTNAGMVSASAPVGQGASDNGASGRDQLRPLPDSIAVDARRDVEHDPQRTHSGFITIDNPHIPFPVHIPTMDGDEPVQWYHTPSFALWSGVSAYSKYIGQPFAERIAVPTMQAVKPAFQIDRSPPRKRRRSLPLPGF